MGDQFEQRPAFHDPRERGPNAGGLLNSQMMQTKKAEMVLHLVFREPAEILYATTTPFCPPPTSHSPNQVMCDVPTGSKRGLSSTLTLHRFVSWKPVYLVATWDGSRSRGRSNRSSFQTATFSGRIYTEPRS
jgi:hypothetical protein